MIDAHRDSFAFSRRKAEAARQELDGVRLLMTELQSQTSGLQAQVKSLEADLAAIHRCDSFYSFTYVPQSVPRTAPSAFIVISLAV